MDQWEYRREVVDDVDRWVTVLNIVGEKGWEFMHAVDLTTVSQASVPPGSTPPAWHLFFKRLKQ